MSVSGGSSDDDMPSMPAPAKLPRYLSRGDKSSPQPESVRGAPRLPAYTEPAVRRVKKSKAHEESAAKSYGGRRLKASGAAPFSRRDNNTSGADVMSDLLLMQHKATERDSLSIKRDWLYEVSVEAARRSKYPALIILFEAEKRVDNEWVAVPRKVFQMLLANQPGAREEPP